MTTSNLPQPNGNMNLAMKGGVWSGVLFVVLGLLGIFLPFFSSVVIETWIGLILASAGLGGLVYAIQSQKEDGFIWKLLLSLLYLGTGVYLFVYPLTGVLTLTLLIGSFLLTEGVFELILGFKLRPNRNWGWVLADGLLTIAFGAFVWLQWPGDATWLLGTLVGASLLSTGISRLVLYFSHAKNDRLERGDATPIVEQPETNPTPSSNPESNPAA
jgi:uncharacterized membrane protein HdeD (DUF308 family)